MGFFSSFKKEGISEKLPTPQATVQQNEIKNIDLPIPPPPTFDAFSNENNNLETTNGIEKKENNPLSTQQTISLENNYLNVPPPPQFNQQFDTSISQLNNKPIENISPQQNGQQNLQKIPEPPLYDPTLLKDNNTPSFSGQSNTKENIEKEKKIADELPPLNLGKNILTQETKPLEKKEKTFPYTQKINILKNQDNIPKALPILPPLSLHELEPLETFNIEKEDFPLFEIDDEPKNKTLPLPKIELFDSEEPSLNIRYNITNRGLFEKKPLFIRTDHYSSILTTIDAVKEYVTNSPTLIYNLENLKKNIDIENKRLKECIEDLQRKIIYVDKVLFERDTNG